MAQHTVLILNQTVPQIQEPQVGDTYLMPRDVEITGDLAISGTVDGRDLALDGAIVDIALIPGDNISDLTNDAGYEANAPLASQGEAEAGVENTKTMTPLRVAQAIAVLAAGIQNKLDATADPVATNDDSEGYSVGSFWINVTTDQAFRCVDASTNIAVWVKTTLQTTDLATVALSGDSDDLTEGATNLLLTAAERSKLAGVEPAATADQTGAEIKAAYEAEADTNAFTDSYKATLDELGGLTTGITAFAGGGQASATLLSTRYNIVETVASVGDSVKLPVTTGGKVVVVKNTGANACDVFPQSGVSINKLAADTALSVPADSTIWFFSTSATQWEAL